MMNTLNHFVTAQLSPEALVDDRGRLQLYREQVLAEKREITYRLLTISYAPTGSREKRAVVQALQEDMMRLLDTLYYYRLSHSALALKAGKKDDLTGFYLEVESVLHEVLIGLEQHFPECLAQELPLPLSYAARVRRQLEMRLNELELLMDSLGLDEPLQELVFRPVREFLHNRDERLNFRTLTYFRELLSQLYVTGMQEMASPDKFHLQVHAILIHLNFNAMEYYLYCISRLRTWLKGYSHLRDRITFLTWCMKEIKSVPVKKGAVVALHPAGSAIAAQLRSWLEEERIFLRNLQEENSARPEPFRESPANAAGRNELEEMLKTIRSSLTESQVALMLRLHVEEEIIVCSSPQKARSLAWRVMKIRQPGGPGEESFAAKYNNPGLSTIKACKAWLTRLMERLNDHEKQLRAYMD